MQLYPTVEKEILVEKYIDKKMSIITIANEYKHGWITIRNWLTYYKIPIRSWSEQASIANLKRGKWQGEDHPSRNPEIFKRMITNHKGLFGKDNPMFGRNFPIEMREKMRKAKLKDTTPLYIQIRNSVRAINWRKAIFERDKYICRVCGEHTRDLEAHHIVSFVGLFRRFKIKTLEEAMNNEKLWGLDNGITLCKKCHKLTNNYGGRGYNNN
jgi:hypothetical protein